MFQSNWRFRLVLMSLVMFAVSGYFSYVEMVYLFQSRSAQASVTGLSDVTERRRGSEHKHIQVDYVFAEATGTHRTGSDSQPLGWRPPPDGRIVVQFTPGEYGRSRIAGNVNAWMLILFAGSFAVLAVFAFLLFLEAREATRPSKRVPERRRRRERER